MKLLLINPSVGYYTRALSNPLGLLSIASYVKKNGHEVRLEDRCVNKVDINKLLKEYKPDIVGISLMSSRGILDAAKVSKAVKAMGIPVVWGGQMPSMQIEEVLANDFVDYVSYGEGEITWLEIMEALKSGTDFSEIKGLAYKKNGEVVITPCREFIDLSTLPMTDYSLIDTPKYMQTYLGCKKMIYIYSSKGCPCRCAFCSNVNFHKSTHRKRSVDTVISEVKYLIDNFGMDGVYFSDELWCTKKSEILEFCSKVKENNLDFHWGVQFRIGMFGEEEFRTMYEAGCRWIFFGVESGSDEMLKRIHKNIDKSAIKPTMDILRKIGITSVCSFIIGFPDETVEQLRDTVDLIKTINANLTPIYHFTPLPGTELYDEMIRENRYKAASTLEELSKVVATESVGVNLSTVPDVDLRVIRSWFHWKAFSNKNAYSKGKSFEFAKQTITSGLHSISLNGPVSFVVNGFKALYEFLYVFWYAHAYPGVRKKYNLK